MKHVKRKIIILLGMLVMALALTACSGNNEPEAAQGQETTRPTIDREGYAITLPDEINTILALGPSNAEILVAMGLGNKIIGVCMDSSDVPGLPPNISTSLSFWMDIDVEYVIELMPDIVFVTGLTRAGGTDPLYAAAAAGISVIYMPTSETIEAVMEDIRFIAAVMETDEQGEAIVTAMQAEIDEIIAIAATITQPRTVLFELFPGWSIGTGTFIHEMIELVGATNIFADQEGWIAVSEEVVLDANPDVILTAADFLDDPVAEIIERPGFDTIAAVQNNNVFQVDANSSQRPSQNITRALREIAQAVFPEYFQ